MGFGFGGAQMMPWIIYPDTVDVAELKLGYKPAGAYSGTMTLVRKVAGAFGVAMVSWILEAAGYLPAIVDEAGVATNQIQSEGVLLAIRLSMGISIVVLISVALFASFMYKVDNNKLMRIRRLVDLEKEVGLEGMSEEDKQEKFELTDLLVGYTRKERIEAEQTLLGVEASAEADVYK
jgi:Na+/melibiose symporter-like transporter